MIITLERCAAALEDLWKLDERWDPAQAGQPQHQLVDAFGNSTVHRQLTRDNVPVWMCGCQAERPLLMICERAVPCWRCGRDPLPALDQDQTACLLWLAERGGGYLGPCRIAGLTGCVCGRTPGELLRRDYPKPDLHGEQSRWGMQYRVYTAKLLPFDAFPSFDRGGPRLLTVPGWAFSTQVASPFFTAPTALATVDRRWRLTLRHVVKFEWVDHPLSNTNFDDHRDAERVAYGAGALGFVVYERDAPRWGLDD